MIEATLKEGARHIYTKRVFYLDEDSWLAVAADEYDARGNLYRASFAYPSYSYDVQAHFGDATAIYDFTSGLYNITGLFGPYAGLKYMTELPKDSFWTADALRGRRALNRIRARVEPGSCSTGGARAYSPLRS